MSRSLAVASLLAIVAVAGGFAQDENVEAPETPKVETLGPRGYRIRGEDVSPDKRFGVLHADSNVIEPEKARNFLVAMRPFRILAENLGFAFYDPGNHRKMVVQWAKDNSVVLVMVGDKWGTVGATLFELREGRVTRRTDFMAAITRLLAAKFPKGKARPYNNNLLFILDGEAAFDLSENGRQIRLDVEGTNNPNVAPKKTWRGTLKAVWSVPAARWIEQKVTARLSAAESE